MNASLSIRPFIHSSFHRSHHLASYSRRSLQLSKASGHRTDSSRLEDHPQFPKSSFESDQFPIFRREIERRRGGGCSLALAFSDRRSVIRAMHTCDEITVRIHNDATDPFPNWKSETSLPTRPLAPVAASAKEWRKADGSRGRTERKGRSRRCRRRLDVGTYVFPGYMSSSHVGRSNALKIHLCSSA